MDETYLGDGLYASFDGGMVKLRAPRGDGDHEVYIDVSILESFAIFCEAVGVAPILKRGLSR